MTTFDGELVSLVVAVASFVACLSSRSVLVVLLSLFIGSTFSVDWLFVCFGGSACAATQRLRSVSGHGKSLLLPRRCGLGSMRLKFGQITMPLLSDKSEYRFNAALPGDGAFCASGALPAGDGVLPVLNLLLLWSLLLSSGDACDSDGTSLSSSAAVVGLLPSKRDGSHRRLNRAAVVIDDDVADV